MSLGRNRFFRNSELLELKLSTILDSGKCISFIDKLHSYFVSPYFPDTEDIGKSTNVNEAGLKAEILFPKIAEFDISYEDFSEGPKNAAFYSELVEEITKLTRDQLKIAIDILYSSDSSVQKRLRFFWPDPSSLEKYLNLFFEIAFNSTSILTQEDIEKLKVYRAHAIIALAEEPEKDTIFEKISWEKVKVIEKKHFDSLLKAQFPIKIKERVKKFLLAIEKEINKPWLDKAANKWAKAGCPDTIIALRDILRKIITIDPLSGEHTISSDLTLPAFQEIFEIIDKIQSKTSTFNIKGIGRTKEVNELYLYLKIEAQKVANYINLKTKTIKAIDAQPKPQIAEERKALLFREAIDKLKSFVFGIKNEIEAEWLNQAAVTTHGYNCPHSIKNLRDCLTHLAPYEDPVTSHCLTINLSNLVEVYLEIEKVIDDIELSPEFSLRNKWKDTRATAVNMLYKNFKIQLEKIRPIGKILSSYCMQNTQTSKPKRP